MRLSTRDLLVLLGIVVAVIITLTTLVYTDASQGTKKAELPKAGKTAFHKFAGEALKKLTKQASFSSLSR